jgi:hypothetical protein
MLSLVFSLIIFSIGFVFGAYFKGLMFDRLDWNMLTWDSSILAYRPARVGTMLHRGDKILMAIKVPSDSIPAGGVKYE